MCKWTHSSLSLICPAHKLLAECPIPTSSGWLDSTRFPGDVCVTFFKQSAWKQSRRDALMEKGSCCVYNCDNEHL